PLAGQPGAAFQGSVDGVTQFVDKDDPTRVARELRFKKFDPLPKGLYSVEGAELWMFLKNGRTLLMQAGKGTVKRVPNTGRLDSGKFYDGVVVRLYEAQPAGARSARIDPATATPIILMYTNSISFDTSIDEITTPDIVSLSTASFEAQGSDLELV